MISQLCKLSEVACKCASPDLLVIDYAFLDIQDSYYDNNGS